MVTSVSAPRRGRGETQTAPRIWKHHKVHVSVLRASTSTRSLSRTNTERGPGFRRGLSAVNSFLLTGLRVRERERRRGRLAGVCGIGQGIVVVADEPRPGDRV